MNRSEKEKTTNEIAEQRATYVPNATKRIESLRMQYSGLNKPVPSGNGYITKTEMDCGQGGIPQNSRTNRGRFMDCGLLGLLECWAPFR